MTATNDAPAPAPSGSGVDWRRELRDAFVAGVNAARERSPLYAGEYADRRLASLASDASPRGEAVAWVQPGYLSMLQKYGSCSMRFEPIEALDYIVPLYAHPAPATMESAARFKIGDRVTKIKGSSWTGRVVGTYSTDPTPEGYAVESETETGSVQIYPAAALAPASEGRKG